jgi:HlyD family secretion protein
MFGRLTSLVRRRPIVSALVALAILGGLYMAFAPEKKDYKYIAQAISSGEVVSKVTASGKLRALNTIKVGAEVSGQITQVNVDFNTPVSAGQVLAVIDPTRFKARVQQAQAQVSLAQASLAQAEAASIRAQTELAIAQREYARRRNLELKGFVSESGLDNASNVLANARAAVRTAQAQMASARAQISQSSAELTSAQLDLRRTVIISPTSGVVINKLVEPGTTVAASFQTPNLFEIAADTTRMQVEASVDEADIGQVREGQEVQFTVDAYPDASFPALVRQIRKGATENQNVVSYLAILDVDNGDGRLLPGMTANVDIITGVKRNVLRVPVQALRFRPKPADRAEDPKVKDTDDEKDDEKRPDPVVYVPSEDAYKPKRRVVAIGVQGEDFVEIVSGLKAGEKVITRSKSLEKKAEAKEPDDEGEDDDAAG